MHPFINNSTSSTFISKTIIHNGLYEDKNIKGGVGVVDINWR